MNTITGTTARLRNDIGNICPNGYIPSWNTD
jgi:hypothetical protein